MKFKFESGEEVENLKEYVANIYKQYLLDPDFAVMVGCDSQNKRYNTVYATCIVFKLGKRGGHFLYTKDYVRPKIKERWNRLWKEVEKSLEVALWLRSNGFKVDRVDLDFNEKEIARSSAMVASARGYVLALGFQCEVKPGPTMATRAADHLVRQ